MDSRERLDFVTHHTRAAMLQHATLETCILTTKMLCHLIPDLLGMRVLPLGVGVIGANQAARIAIEGGAIVKTNKPAGEVVLMCSHRGDQADKPGEWWGGHLVLIADGRYLVDGSADQFDTPEVGLRTHPFVADLGTENFMRSWLWSDDMIGFDLPDGACIGYEPHLEDTSYRPSMDWDETQPGDKMYDEVAARVGGLLEIYQDHTLTPAMLPQLPPTLSRKHGDTADAIYKRELKSALELGYTQKELSERVEREKARQAVKEAKDMGQKFHDVAEAMAFAEKETLGAIKQMESKLREAVERAGAAGRYYDQAESPLMASSPPSSS